MNAGAVTGIEVTLEYTPLAFIYGLCPAFAIINGVENRTGWGTFFFPVPPGRYNVACYTNYLFISRCGLNSMDIDIYPGQIVRVTWSAPPITFMKGAMRAEVRSSV